MTSKYTQSAVVDGQEVRVGDHVWFKSDVEQMGIVSAIYHRDKYGAPILTLNDDCGFSGEYIGGKTSVRVPAGLCWL